MGHNHSSMRTSTSCPRWVKLTGITQSSSISHLVEIGPSRQGACTPFALQLPVPWSWDAGMGGGDLLVLNGCAWGGCAHLIFWLGDWNLPPAYREQWRIWLNGMKRGVSWLKPQAPVKLGANELASCTAVASSTGSNYIRIAFQTWSFCDWLAYRLLVWEEDFHADVSWKIHGESDCDLLGSQQQWIKF